jgi:hypothetical protein
MIFPVTDQRFAVEQFLNSILVILLSADPPNSSYFQWQSASWNLISRSKRS